MSKKFKSLICLLLLTLSALSVSAQQNKRLTVQIQNGTVLDCIKSIEGQTDYSFLFSNSIGVEKKVSVNCVNQTLDQVLSAVFTQNGIAYDIQGNQITLRKGNQPTGQQQGQRTVYGKVVDANGNPIPGAGIMVAGTTLGTVSGNDGSWSLPVPAGPLTLDVSSLGYSSSKVSLTGAQTMVNVTLEEDVLALDELVVVGYSSAKKRDLISSVFSVKTAEIANLPTTNITQGLAGRSPGLIVVQSGGGVNVKPTVSIRGGGEPIYVIDGVIRSSDDFRTLSPEDIDQMNILKDASATAVYGARAANGIIQITTKNGSDNLGVAKVDYDFNYSLAQPANWPEKLDTYTQATYLNLARTNDGFEPQYGDAAMQALKNGTDPEHYGNYNYHKLYLRDWAPQIKHNVRLTGGNKDTHYYASLGNTYQQSLFKTGTHWLDRTNLRLAVSTLIKPINLQVNASVDGYRELTNFPNSFQGGNYGMIFSHMNDQRGFTPGLNKYGLTYGTENNGIAEMAKDAGYIRDLSNVLNGRGELVWTCPWIKGFKIRATADYRYFSTSNKSWQKEPARYGWDSTVPLDFTNPPILKITSNTGYGLTTQALAEYSNTFGLHSISAVAGYEQYYENTSSFWAQRENFQFEVDQLLVGDANKQTNSGYEAELGRKAWIGQARYNYAGKYYLEGSARYDGSDYFAPGKRWGLFLGGSVGWIVSEEGFMKPLKDNHVFDMLKLRGSYGETGMDSSAGRFAYLASYNLSSTALVVNGNFVPGFTEGALPSPDLTWYTTRQTDAGFDFASLNSRLYGSFDWFYYSTFGYLVTPTGQTYMNTAFGQAMPKVKSDSEFRREGIEIQLGWKDRIGDFTYDISGNFTFFDQLWAYDQSEPESSYMDPYLRTQQQRGYYAVMLHNLGYYKSAEDVYNSPAIVGAISSSWLTAGDIKYEDTNGDGKIDSSDNRRVGKNSFPRGQYGLSVNLGWKGFYLSMLFQGATSFNMNLDNPLNNFSMYKHQLDTWTPDNTDAKYPRLTSNYGLAGGNNVQYSDFWLLNGAYLRMKDFQFGYDFKYAALKNLKWISRARLGLSGQNIFTISDVLKYSLDPESGSTLNWNYPVDRVLALTLNIGF